MDTSTEIKVSFAYTFSDWASGTLFRASRTLGNVFQVLILIIILGLAGYHLWRSSFLWRFHVVDYNFWLALFWLIYAIETKFDLIKLLKMWFRYRRNASKPPKVYEFTFDETGARYQLSTESDVLDVKQAWMQFRKVLENEQAFLLVHKDGGDPWIIPKRHFDDTEEIETLRDLFKRKVGKATE